MEIRRRGDVAVVNVSRLASKPISEYHRYTKFEKKQKCRTKMAELSIYVGMAGPSNKMTEVTTEGAVCEMLVDISTIYSPA
eukprot:scaffold15108_cov180-Amphora_coffeaeformis.AAC.83